MLGMFLGIFVPIGYILFGSLCARHVARTMEPDMEIDRVMGSVLIGVLWPLAMPFYLAIHGEVEARKARNRR